MQVSRDEGAWVQRESVIDEAVGEEQVVPVKQLSYNIHVKWPFVNYLGLKQTLIFGFQLPFWSIWPILLNFWKSKDQETRTAIKKKGLRWCPFYFKADNTNHDNEIILINMFSILTWWVCFWVDQSFWRGREHFPTCYLWEASVLPGEWAWWPWSAWSAWWGFRFIHILSKVCSALLHAGWYAQIKH